MPASKHTHFLFRWGILSLNGQVRLTYWGRVMHICINKLTIFGSDNGLLPERHQAIIWTNAGILLIGPLGTNFNEMLIQIYVFSFKKMHLKSARNCRSFHLSLNVLNGFVQLVTVFTPGRHSLSLILSFFYTPVCLSIHPAACVTEFWLMKDFTVQPVKLCTMSCNS